MSFIISGTPQSKSITLFSINMDPQLNIEVEEFFKNPESKRLHIIKGLSLQKTATNSPFRLLVQQRMHQLYHLTENVNLLSLTEEEMISINSKLIELSESNIVEGVVRRKKVTSHDKASFFDS